jgi:8-oxo-dGTP diphosphatase
MTVFLVRHAKAENRNQWEAPDDLRPLDQRGLEQAAELGRRLIDEGVVRVISSPYLRCVQTVEPLADKVGCNVEKLDELAEGSRFDAVLGLVNTVGDGTVLCSHGDVIPDVIRALERRGLVIDGVRDFRKASTWVIERADGVCVRAHAIAPPDVDD